LQYFLGFPCFFHARQYKFYVEIFIWLMKIKWKWENFELIIIYCNSPIVFSFLNGSNHSFKAHPGGSTQDPVNPELEPGRVEEKTGEEKIQQDPVATRWFLFF
jgi:hypothetical protein